jgi:hypothetical protein
LKAGSERQSSCPTTPIATKSSVGRENIGDIITRRRFKVGFAVLKSPMRHHLLCSQPQWPAYRWSCFISSHRMYGNIQISAISASSQKLSTPWLHHWPFALSLCMTVSRVPMLSRFCRAATNPSRRLCVKSFSEAT